MEVVQHLALYKLTMEDTPVEMDTVLPSVDFMKLLNL